jgi:hypothetical protein
LDSLQINVDQIVLNVGPRGTSIGNVSEETATPTKRKRISAFPTNADMTPSTPSTSKLPAESPTAALRPNVDNSSIFTSPALPVQTTPSASFSHFTTPSSSDVFSSPSIQMPQFDPAIMQYLYMQQLQQIQQIQQASTDMAPFLPNLQTMPPVERYILLYLRTL